MTDPGTPKTEKKNNFLRLLPGLVISLAAIVILLTQIDLKATAAAFKTLRLGQVALAVAILLLAFLTRALSWRVQLQEQVSLISAYSAEVTGYMLNAFLPFRLGEVGRALMLGIRSSLTFWEIFPTVVIERIFDLGFLAILLFSTLPFVVGAEWASTAALGSAAMVLVGFGVLYAMVLKPDWVLKLFRWASGKFPRLRQAGEEKIELFLRGLAVLRSPGRFLKVTLWLAVTWVLSIAWNTIMLRSFYPQPTLLEAGFIVGLAALGVAAPSTQGNLGVYEAAIVSAFVALSADPAKGLAFALVTHGLFLLVVFIMGFSALAREKISLREIYSLAQNRHSLGQG